MQDLPWGQIHHPVHGVLSEIRIKGVGRKAVSLVSQLLQFCACPQPLQKRDLLSFKLLNQYHILGKYLPSSFPCKLLARHQGQHLIVWDGRDKLIICLPCWKRDSEQFHDKIWQILAVEDNVCQKFRLPFQQLKFHYCIILPVQLYMLTSLLWSNLHSYTSKFASSGVTAMLLSTTSLPRSGKGRYKVFWG